MAARRTDGWWYPWIFVGCMFLVVVVNGVLAYLAVASWTGLDTEDYYRRGLAYNDTIAAAEAQDRRGWRMELALTPEKGTQGRRVAAVAADFEDRTGRPLSDLNVEVMLTRPTNEGSDLTIALANTGNGSYAAKAAVPLPGQWDARVIAWRGGDRFQASQRVFLPW